MKKKICLVLILLIVFINCGCSKSWEKQIQISALKYENDYIVGKVKNLTNKAYKVTIHFKVKSGTLIDTKNCYETLKPNETKDLECLAFKLDETYSFEINNVELEEFEIPKLEKGTIDIETLKYHFEDIYNTHTYNFAGISTYMNKSTYPYIDSIEYNDDEIEIHGSLYTNDKKSIIFWERFNSKTEDFLHLLMYVSIEDKELIRKVASSVSMMKPFSTSVQRSQSIYEALLKDDILYGYCVRLGDICVTNYDEGEEFKAFSIGKKV